MFSNDFDDVYIMDMDRNLYLNKISEISIKQKKIDDSEPKT
jgi:hypothetical protein